MNSPWKMMIMVKSMEQRLINSTSINTTSKMTPIPLPWLFHSSKSETLSSIITVIDFIVTR